MRDTVPQELADDWGIPETVWQLGLPEIRFGRNSLADLGVQLEQLGVPPEGHGVLVTDETLVDIGHATRVQEQAETGGFSLDVYDGSQREPHVNDIDDCVRFVRKHGDYDFYVGLGGGSALDTAKIIRTVVAGGGDTIEYVAEPTGDGKQPVRPDAPLVLLPTTCGSPAQVTPHSIVRTDNSETKAVVSGTPLAPDAILLDPAFSVTLPDDLTAQTAMDVLGGVLESYTAPPVGARTRTHDPSVRSAFGGRTQLTDVFAERAIRLLADNLRTAVHSGTDVEARSNVMLGALFAAIASLTTGATLGHATTYAIQARYHTKHSETVGVLTPASTLEYNVASDPERFARIAELLGADTNGLATRAAAERAKDEFVRLQQDLAVLPSGLEELVGLDADDEDVIAGLAAWTMDTQDRLLRKNPRVVTERGVKDVFRDAVNNWE